MSRSGKVTRQYRHNTQILNRLSEATGLTPYSIKRTAKLLVSGMDAELPTLTIEEWRRRYVS